MAESTTAQLQGLIDRLKAGDPSVRGELIARAGDRLHRLAHKMLQDYRSVKRFEETDDVLQNVRLRLLRALEAVPLASVQEFFRLAAAQLRDRKSTRLNSSHVEISYAVF